MDTAAMLKITYGLYIVGSKLDGKMTGSVVDAFMQTTVTPTPTVVLSCIKTNQTNAAIKQTGEFMVSILGTKVNPFVVANFGFQSGRDVDKWANVAHEDIDGLPILADSVAYLRCKVVDAKELSTHTVFFCEVTEALLGEGEPLVYGDYQKDMRVKAMEAFKHYKSTGEVPEPPAKWVCRICNYLYTGETPFEDLPDDWKCPKCGAPKSEFIKQQ